MVVVINDIDLLIDWIGKVNHIVLTVLRLFGKVVGCAVFHQFLSVQRLESNLVLLVAGQYSAIGIAVTPSELLPVRLWSKNACSETSFSLLSLVCYVPMFRPKAAFLCGRHDRIISTWHRFTIMIYNCIR